MTYGAQKHTDKWFQLLNKKRLACLLLEIVICGMAPFPWNRTVYWPYINDNFERDWVWVPLDVIFGSLIVLRVYLLARFTVLHSRLYSSKHKKTATIKFHKFIIFTIKLIKNSEKIRKILKPAS